uniref:Ig-like domain-containing protein n=1 Tax=Pygocentrus nattereri TaxID=42514 RepID=A0AAR2KVS8_PYGNA
MKCLSLKQSPDIFANEGENVTLKCAQIKTTYNGMYWFRQRPAVPLEPIAYYYINMPTVEDKFEKKVSAVRTGASLDLTVKTVQSTDSAVYFCAKQDAQQEGLIFNLNKNYTTFFTTDTQPTPARCIHKRVPKTSVLVSSLILPAQKHTAQ